MALKMAPNQFLGVCNGLQCPLKWVKIPYDQFEMVRDGSQNGLKSIFRGV